MDFDKLKETMHRYQTAFPDSPTPVLLWDVGFQESIELMELALSVGHPLEYGYREGVLDGLVITIQGRPLTDYQA